MPLYRAVVTGQFPTIEQHIWIPQPNRPPPYLTSKVVTGHLGTTVTKPHTDCVSKNSAACENRGRFQLRSRSRVVTNNSDLSTSARRDMIHGSRTRSPEVTRGHTRSPEVTGQPSVSASRDLTPRRWRVTSRPQRPPTSPRTELELQ